jgi:hypothetical protein
MNAEPTKLKLARALRDVGLDRLATAAEQGRYDDFESASATPLMDLVRDIREASPTADKHGPGGILDRVMDGEFDASQEEARAWFENEGQYLLRGRDRNQDGGGNV